MQERDIAVKIGNGRGDLFTKALVGHSDETSVRRAGDNVYICSGKKFTDALAVIHRLGIEFSFTTQGPFNKEVLLDPDVTWLELDWGQGGYDLKPTDSARSLKEFMEERWPQIPLTGKDLTVLAELDPDFWGPKK